MYLVSIPQKRRLYCSRLYFVDADSRLRLQVRFYSLCVDFCLAAKSEFIGAMTSSLKFMVILCMADGLTLIMK